MTAETTQVALDGKLEYFVDESRQWHPGAGLPAPGGWQKVSDRPNGINFGFTDKPIWFRVVLRSETARTYVWQFAASHLASVQWVIDSQGQPTRTIVAGVENIKSGHIPPQRVPSARLVVEPGHDLTVHIRVQTKSIARLSMRLWDVDAWTQSERTQLLSLGAFFGLVGGLLVYNGFLWLRLRDASYGYYVAFGLCVTSYQLGLNGIWPTLLWPSHAIWTYQSMVFSGCLIGLTGAVFALHFLRMKTFSPLCFRLTQGIVLFWGVALAVYAWVPTGRFEHVLILPGIPITTLLLTLFGLLAWLRKVPASGYWLLSWIMLLVASSLQALAVATDSITTPVLRSSLQIASAAEILLLSLALADRITLERRARTDAELQRVREQAAREKAQHALDEKSRLMAAITHDLQHPLYALSLAAESVTRRGSETLPQETWQQMRAAVYSAEQLIASLAMSVRLDRDALQPEFEIFSVQNMLERIDTMFTERAHRAGLRWRVLPSIAVVHSDPVMLERMICNLVSNALRYTRQGGVLLSARKRGNHLLIQVWDTGVGIAESEQATIFEAYQRGTAAQSHDLGLGLGLSIVQRCAQQLQVRVGLRSVPGKGSCFALWVPLATEAA